MRIVVYLYCLSCLPLLAFASDTPPEDPPTFADVKKAGFTKFRFGKLSPADQEAYYQAYQPDREILEKVKLGLITKSPVNECIIGEAPNPAIAWKIFPAHYPMKGRMKNTRGIFEWKGKDLRFKTKTQTYHVKEFHIVHRLKEMGVVKGGKPKRAEVEAIWMMNTYQESGLQIVFMQHIKLI